MHLFCQNLLKNDLSSCYSSTILNVYLPVNGNTKLSIICPFGKQKINHKATITTKLKKV